MEGLQAALPQIVLLVVFGINLLTSFFNSDRNTKASFVATVILLDMTYWGGFFEPLIDFFGTKL